VHVRADERPDLERMLNDRKRSVSVGSIDLELDADAGTQATGSSIARLYDLEGYGRWRYVNGHERDASHNG
jgi:hypothetical protein